MGSSIVPIGDMNFIVQLQHGQGRLDSFVSFRIVILAAQFRDHLFQLGQLVQFGTPLGGLARPTRTRKASPEQVGQSIFSRSRVRKGYFFAHGNGIVGHQDFHSVLMVKVVIAVAHTIVIDTRKGEKETCGGFLFGAPDGNAIGIDFLAQAASQGCQGHGRGTNVGVDFFLIFMAGMVEALTRLTIGW